jgi:hypothetical protein
MKTGKEKKKIRKRRRKRNIKTEGTIQMQTQCEKELENKE